MGIDYKNIIMYGKEFGSIDCAAEYLLSQESITEENYESIVEDGEFYFDGDSEHVLEAMEWQVYNAYSGGVGVAGLCFSAKEIYIDPVKTKEWTEKLDTIMEGCTWHEFVKVF